MELHPLNSPLGAIVSGINICQSMNSEQTAFIERALADYGVLVFKEQFISEEDQLLFTKSFGDHHNSNLFSKSKDIDSPSSSVVHRGKNDFVDYWTDGPKFKNVKKPSNWHNSLQKEEIEPKIKNQFTRTEQNWLNSQIIRLKNSVNSSFENSNL